MFLSINSFAQPGFIKVYNSDEYGQNLFNGLIYDQYKNNNILTAGITLSEGRIAIRFTRFDTLGNMYNNKVIRDSTAHLSAFEDRSNLYKTNNGNYIMAGMHAAYKFIYTILLDSELNFLSLNKYYPKQNNILYPCSLIEVDDGFLMLGENQYILDTFYSPKDSTILLTNRIILKLDKNGKELWRKEDTTKYAQVDIYKIKKDDDIYVICGSRFSFLKNYFYSTLYAIDENGNKQWSMEKTFYFDNMRAIGGIYDFIHNPDGSWICTTRITTEFHEEEFSWTEQLAIFKMDKDFNLIWFKKLPEKSIGFPIALTDLIRTKDGNYLASGYVAFRAIHYKFDAAGDEIWSRLDRAYPDNNYAKTLLSKTIELPSGNIMSCGYANGDKNKKGNFGMLMKLTADGCMDIADCPNWVSLEEVASESLEISVFPNPTHEYATFTKISEVLQKNVDIKIYDVMGKHIQDLQISEFEKSYQWDVLNLPNGVYFCQMYLDGELFAVEKLIKQ